MEEMLAPARRCFMVFGLALLLFFAGCALQSGNDLSGNSSSDLTVCGANGNTYATSALAQAAGTTVAHTGECTSSAASCSDGDGGRDTFAAGAVLAGNGNYYYDECKDASTVKEYFCDNGVVSEAELPCPSGYSCTSGACTVVPCSDTDNGAVAETKGTATSGSTSQTDVCSGETAVNEYYCSDGAISSRSMDCGTGKHCENGACIAYTCVDSDGGQDAAEAGTATLGSTSSKDSCIDTGTVKEYYCEGGQITSKNTACGTGKTCKDGACVEITCVDSDGGQIKGTKGTATLGAKTNTDTCYSDTMVVEYYCSSGNIQYATLSCGTGYVCSEGACIVSDCEEDENDLDEDDETWYPFKTVSSLKMYVGERAQIYSKYEIGLESVDEDSATFTLYDTDGDDLCTDSIDEDSTVSKFCSKSGVSVEVDSVINGTSATIKGDLAYLQVYTQEGTVKTYSGTTCTGEDEYDVETETSRFYPRISSGTVMLLGGKYTISAVDVDDQTVTMKIDGDSEEIEDGEEVEINGDDYTFSFEFSDYGLTKWTVEKS